MCVDASSCANRVRLSALVLVVQGGLVLTVLWFLFARSPGHGLPARTIRYPTHQLNSLPLVTVTVTRIIQYVIEECAPCATSYFLLNFLPLCRNARIKRGILGIYYEPDPWWCPGPTTRGYELPASCVQERWYIYMSSKVRLSGAWFASCSPILLPVD